MKIKQIITIIVLLLLYSPEAPAAIARPLSELIEQFAKKYGIRLGGDAAEAMNRSFLHHGDEALKAFKNGGPALAEAVSRHGDELVEAAIRVPNAVPSLARQADELLPLYRRYGDDILHLESRAHGLAVEAARVFPDIADIRRLAKLPIDDASRTVAYARHADSPVTARMLLDQVERNGPGIFERLASRKILAYGLSAAMISSAVIISSKSSDGIAQGFNDLMQIVVASAMGMLGLLAGILLIFSYPGRRLRRWLFRRRKLMRA